MNTIEIIKAFPGIEADVRAAMFKACATKGRFAGYISESKPTDPAGRVAREALLLVLTANRGSLSEIMAAPEHLRDLFGRVCDAMELKTPISNGKAMGRIKLITAIEFTEPFARWSLVGQRLDSVKFDAALSAALQPKA